jgi:hypothetical protein
MIHQLDLIRLLNIFDYRTISIKSTGGVTRDPIYLFDISTPAKILRDHPEIFNIRTRKFSEISLFGILGPLLGAV